MAGGALGAEGVTRWVRGLFLLFLVGVKTARALRLVPPVPWMMAALPVALSGGPAPPSLFSLEPCSAPWSNQDMRQAPWGEREVISIFGGGEDEGYDAMLMP